LTKRYDKVKPRASSKLVGAFGQLPEKAFDWAEAYWRKLKINLVSSPKPGLWLGGWMV
jgi:hypothetical protein